ncbi:MAG: prolipoprotein diacylglyceryl transferase family protein [Patescibacteria group bacterium]
MHPILFKIGSFTFYTHGLLAVMGIIAGSLLLYYLARKERLATDVMFDNIIYSVLAGIIGARITYFTLYRDQFGSFSEIFYLWNGGMVSYGGFILGGIILFLLFKRQKQNVKKWLDIASLAFPLGLILGRLGNLFAGEYAGIATQSKFNMNGLVPVTLLEGILLALIFLILLLARIKLQKIKEGTIFIILLLSYGLGRFIIDFWRDEKDIIWKISTGQSISIIVFLAGLALFLSYFVPLKKRK